MAHVMEYVGKTEKVREEFLEKSPEKKMLDALALRLGSCRFDLWFGSESSVRREDQKLVFQVKNRFAADWIRANFKPEIDQASQEVYGKTFSCQFQVAATPNGSTTLAENLIDPTQSGIASGPHYPHSPSLFATEEASKHLATPSASKSPSKGLPSGPILTPSKGPLHSLNILTPPPSGVQRATPVTPGRRFASLESFVRASSNHLACQAAELAIHHPGQINPIYIFGSTSVGKTHLLEGIWSAVRRQSNRKPPLYMNAEQFISAFVEGIQSGFSQGGIQSFRARFRNISLLLIDDIQFFSRKDATQTELLHTIDTLRGQGVQMIFSGDRPLRELCGVQGLRSEILCRLEAGMVCEIKQPERETALKIFQGMAARRQLPIGPDVCRFVASRLGAHARQLSGALNRLHAVHLAGGEPITLAVAEETLGDLIRNNRRNVRLEDIEKAVCDTFGLSEESLQSKSRKKQITTPRMLAMWLARKHTRSALSEIGKYFGDRSHSTVVTAQKKVDCWVDENHPIHADNLELPIGEAIQKIERILQSG